jgi:hypothetical protein
LKWPAFFLILVSGVGEFICKIFSFFVSGWNCCVGSALWLCFQSAVAVFGVLFCVLGLFFSSERGSGAVKIPPTSVTSFTNFSPMVSL